MIWRIDEARTLYDSFLVEADTREEAIAKHRAGESTQEPVSLGDSEIVDVTAEVEDAAA